MYYFDPAGYKLKNGDNEGQAFIQFLAQGRRHLERQLLAGTRPAPDSGAVDRTKATGSSAVPASGQNAWTPSPRQRLIAWAPLCLA